MLGKQEPDKRRDELPAHEGYGVRTGRILWPEGVILLALHAELTHFLPDGHLLFIFIFHSGGYDYCGYGHAAPHRQHRRR